jgi:NAD(P)-dependent dehydrogenase (short-subunit alcohol dehydrogenase family)
MAERGLCAAGVPVDIRDRASVESLFDELAKRALPDLVVQSAGGQYPSAAIDSVDEGWTVPRPNWLRDATRALDAAGEGDPS